MEGDFTLGGKHTTHSDVLQNCTLETSNFIIQCHPNKLNKKGKIINNYFKSSQNVYFNPEL